MEEDWNYEELLTERDLLKVGEVDISSRLVQTQYDLIHAGYRINPSNESDAAGQHPFVTAL